MTRREPPADRQAVDDALREERDFLESLIETAPAIVLVLDVEGRIVRFNPFFERITGRRLAEVQGADWFDTFLPAAERERVRAVFERIVRGERTSGSVDAALATDRGELAIEWHNTTLHDAGGHVHGVLSIGLDVTERRQLEQQLLHAQKMEAIGRLAGGVAHDFNNLLMGVLGCCRIAARELDDAHPARALIEEIGAEAERGVGLTRQLLTFSRKHRPRPRPIDLNDTITRVRTLAQGLVGAQVRIGIRLAPGGAPIVADPMQIEQVLMNLVVNARDAMPGGGRLDIETAAVELHNGSADRAAELAPGAYVALVVRDTGVGMDPRTLARIFEPFFTTKGAGEGTGLGLSTAYGIVTQLGGHIGVESQPGKGTCFRILLPRSDRPTAPADAPRPAVPMSGGRQTILVVEDERLVRTAISQALQALGYRVLSASSGAQALALAGTGRPIDLVLLDMVLPDLAGRELAARIRELQPHVRALYMSAHSADHLVDTGLLGMDEPLLEKPFTDDVLVARIRGLLGS